MSLVSRAYFVRPCALYFLYLELSMNYTNNHNIPLPLAVFLATDHYDYVPNTISTTSLLKPIRQLILADRLYSKDNVVDLSDMVSSRMGTAIHTAIEQAWLNPTKALKTLGYDDSIIERIKINPTAVNKDDIPVYMEKRSFKEVSNYTVSGKFDFVAEGKVQDFKSTSVYGYMNQSNADKYIWQGSIYRWLNQDIITKDEMIIHYIFTDWSKTESLKNPAYPKARVLSQKYPLNDLVKTEQFIKDKLAMYDEYKTKDEKDIPLCTDEELWRKPTVWKYYKNPNSVKSTKNFDNPSQAYALQQTNGCGVVKEVKGQVSACKYCPAFMLCTQKDVLISNGDLVL